MPHDAQELEQRAVALSEVERRLAERGRRFTRQRRAVAETVLGAHQPITANEIHDMARTRCPDLGLMTVYRTLELLTGVGVVRSVHSDEHSEAFVPASSRHGHAVVCSLCGRAAEFTDCHIQAVAQAAAHQTGFAISDHFLQFSGVCRECQLRQRSESDRRAASARRRGGSRAKKTQR